MATFRCNRSGNTVSFSNENDIAGMRNHEGYKEVHDEVQAPIKAVETHTETETLPAFFGEVRHQVQDVQAVEVQVLKKRRGRQPKTVV